MNILTSPTFWIIIGAIVLIMALIGYLAEGTDLANKALNKKTKEKKEKEEKQTVEEVIPTPVADINAKIFPDQSWQTNLDNQLGNSVVAADAPIEVLKVQEEPNAWSDNAPKIDERQETVHTVPTVDDWSMIPNDSQTPSTDLPEVQLDNLNKADMSNDSEMFPDIKPSDLETPVSIEEPEVINNNSNEDIWKA